MTRYLLPLVFAVTSTACGDSPQFDASPDTVEPDTSPDTFEPDTSPDTVEPDTDTTEPDALPDTTPDVPVCTHDCVAGATRCTDGTLTTCEPGPAGCLVWSAPSPCADGFCADAASCGGCDHQCTTAGATRCLNGALTTCVADTHGCRAWSTPAPCEDGFCADNGACGGCDDTCARGTTQCSSGASTSCVADTHGCLDWAAPIACADGFCADTSACGTCQHTCEAGATECSDGQLRTCVADGFGCRAWSAPTTCDEGFCGDTSACGTCQHTCEAGATECSGGQLRTCVADPNGCRAWSTRTPCANGFCASPTICGVCTESCAIDDVRCHDDAEDVCIWDGFCTRWAPLAACTSGAGCHDESRCATCAVPCRLGELACNGRQLETCKLDSGGLPRMTTTKTCTDSCVDDSCWGCSHTCGEVGITRCEGAIETTCVADANGCRSWGQARTCSGVCDAQKARCECDHECDIIGATCAGSVLETCIVGLDGCREKLTRLCENGCDGDACTGCTTWRSGILDTLANDQRAYHKELVVDGTTLIGNWDGRRGNVRLSNSALATIDVGTPTALAFKNESAATYIDQYPRHLHRNASRLYLATLAGLEVHALANVGTPIGTYALTDILDVSIDGNRGCVVTANGLHVLDLTPASPTLVTRFQGIAPPREVVCAADHAAITGTGRIQIVALNTQPPTVVADQPVANLTNQSATLTFDGTRVFNVRNNGTLDAYDFIAGVLTKRGTLTGLPSVTETKLVGDTLYVGLANAAGAIDVTDVRTPKWRWIQSLPDTPQGIAANGGYVFTASNGITAIDSARVSPIHTWTETDSLRHGVVHGSIAYLARNSALVIEDVSVPQAPKRLSRTALGPAAVSLRGTQLLVVTHANSRVELRSYDVTLPHAPRLVAKAVAPPNSAYIGRAQFEGTRAWSHCDVGSLCLFDVTEPCAPRFVVATSGVISSGDSPFVFSGDIVVRAHYDELRIIDMSTPANPIVRSTVTYPHNITNIGELAVTDTLLVHSGRCAIGGSNPTICTTLVDIENPANPRVLGTLQAPVRQRRGAYEVDDYGVTGVVVRDTIAFVQLPLGGLMVIDIADPANPRYQGELWTPSGPDFTLVMDRYLRADTGQSATLIDVCR